MKPFPISPPLFAFVALTVMKSSAGDITPKASAPDSYYRAPKSYSTTRDPDLPKYARHAQDVGLGTLSDVTWLDLGLDYRFRAEYRDDDIRRATDGLDEPL